MMHMGCRGKKRRVREGSGMGVELARILRAFEPQRGATGGAEIAAHTGRAFKRRRGCAGPAPLPVFEPHEPHLRRTRSPATAVAMAHYLQKRCAMKGKPRFSTEAMPGDGICLGHLALTHLILRRDTVAVWIGDCKRDKGKTGTRMGARLGGFEAV